MELDDPARFRRPEGVAVPLPSLNGPRAAGAIEGSFGPGQAGRFGEGGSVQRIQGPLSAGPVAEQLTDSATDSGAFAAVDAPIGALVPAGAVKLAATAWCPMMPQEETAGELTALGDGTAPWAAELRPEGAAARLDARMDVAIAAYRSEHARKQRGK